MRPSAAQLAMWVALAIAASALLFGILRWEREQSRTRWSSLVEGRPRVGSELYRAKGCVLCHDGVGSGETGAPSLAAESASRSRPDQLVTIMWNHGPQMWERMQEEGVLHPEFNQQEMADLLAYLYTVRYVGEPGNPAQGEILFESKHCAACHAVRGRGGRSAKDLSAAQSAASSVGWAAAMWNHPALRGESTYSRFAGREMTDIVSYVRGGSVAPRLESQLLTADFGRGWKVFREKSCMACHSVKDEAGRIGPELGPGHELPSTVVELAGSIWNHSPAMWQAMEHLHIERPAFRETEIADLIAFLYSFRYAEPGGSAKVGEVLFAGRGCSRCHGPLGLGTPRGPGLRGRGKTFTSVTMAAALWRHGPAMYRRARDLGLPWPRLAENDVGDLITFLNTSLEGER